MKNVKEIFLYILIVIAAVFIIFAIVKYRGSEKELAASIEKLESAEIRVDNITEQFKQARKIIDDLQKTIGQERIDYSRLEENNRQLEITIAEQREIYKRFAESNRIDSEGIKRIKELTESSANIIREIFKELNN